MGVFRQLGDHVCLCQHHDAAYEEEAGNVIVNAQTARYWQVGNGAAAIAAQITTTERCCLNVMAAMVIEFHYNHTDFEIERPLGSIRTTQETTIVSGTFALTHHAAWEVLDPGTHTYLLINRSGANRWPWAAWIKAVASDCEG